MAREYKHYLLKSANRPTKSKLLLSTVSTLDKEGVPGYCYVSFSEKLVQTVGRKLPQGISETNPAYLLVMYNKGWWIIYAGYMAGGPYCELWRTLGDTPPSWLKFYKRKVKNHGDHQKNSKNGSKSATR